jgi:hypothetical protein
VLLLRLGYWGERGSGLPDPASFVDESWDDTDRDLVAGHLDRGFVARAYMGYSTCRICGAQNGSLELTDGVYLWPEGLGHYVTVHSVRLPDSFVNHVRSFTDAIESADVDESWWRSRAD